MADAHASGACPRKGMEVQVLSSAPRVLVRGRVLLVISCPYYFYRQLLGPEQIRDKE